MTPFVNAKDGSYTSKPKYFISNCKHRDFETPWHVRFRAAIYNVKRNGTVSGVLSAVEASNKSKESAFFIIEKYFTVKGDHHMLNRKTSLQCSCFKGCSKRFCENQSKNPKLTSR